MIVDKIKTVLQEIGVSQLYGNVYELNVFVGKHDFRNNGKLAYISRLSDSKIVDGKERATLTIFFLDIANWDADSDEVYDVQRGCYSMCVDFLNSINKGNSLVIYDQRIQYVYEKTDDILCGVAVLVDIEEQVGICNPM